MEESVMALAVRKPAGPAPARDPMSSAKPAPRPAAKGLQTVRQYSKAGAANMAKLASTPKPEAPKAAAVTDKPPQAKKSLASVRQPKAKAKAAPTPDKTSPATASTSTPEPKAAKAVSAPKPEASASAPAPVPAKTAAPSRVVGRTSVSRPIASRPAFNPQHQTATSASKVGSPEYVKKWKSTPGMKWGHSETPTASVKSPSPSRPSRIGQLARRIGTAIHNWKNRPKPVRDYKANVGHAARKIGGAVRAGLASVKEEYTPDTTR